jgi:hypothetical protein
MQLPPALAWALNMMEQSGATSMPPLHGQLRGALLSGGEQWPLAAAHAAASLDATARPTHGLRACKSLRLAGACALPHFPCHSHTSRCDARRGWRRRAGATRSVPRAAD